MSILTRVGFWALGALCLDAGTKFLAAAAYRHGILSGLIVDTYNPDFSMGIATAPHLVLIAISLTFLIGFGGWCMREAMRRRIPPWEPGLLIGGASSNLLDRIAFGAVHDWLQFRSMTLNLADVVVLVGILGLTISLARPYIFKGQADRLPQEERNQASHVQRMD